MKNVKFGRTGLRVSELCLGTMTMGLQADEPTSHAILDTAFDAGINFIDTADVYPSGREFGEHVGLTEEVIGRWLTGGKRDQVVLASKFFFPMGSNPWEGGGNRRHIMTSIDNSLRRLNTDYLDLYQIHMFDRHTPIDETLQALDDVVKAGKVRYIGCSNHDAWHLARAIGRSETLGLMRYESVQPRYNILFRNIERELLPLCAHDDVAVIPYNPLAGGFLTGKHERGEPDANNRFSFGTAAERYRERYWADDKFDMLDALRPMADEAGLTMVGLALAWVLANPQITAPIVGASKPEQLADSIAAVDAPLNPEIKAKIDDLTAHYRTVDAVR